MLHTIYVYTIYINIPYIHILMHILYIYIYILYTYYIYILYMYILYIYIYTTIYIYIYSDILYIIPSLNRYPAFFTCMAPRGDCVTPQPGISRPVVRADAWWELEAHDATNDGMEPTMDWFSWENLQETPHCSWENGWFPVKIFP